VARSSKGVLGPYEKNSQVLISGKDIREPSVIIVNENYHLVFESREENNVLLVSLNWESDWPYAVTFRSILGETPASCPKPITCPEPVACPICPKCWPQPVLGPKGKPGD